MMLFRALLQVVLLYSSSCAAGRGLVACMGFYNASSDHRIEFKYEFGELDGRLVMAFVKGQSPTEGCYAYPNEARTEMVLTVHIPHNESRCGLAVDEAHSINFTVFVVHSRYIIQKKDIMYNLHCDFRSPRTQTINTGGLISASGETQGGFQVTKREVVRMHVVDGSNDSVVLTHCQLGSSIRLRVDLQISSTAKAVKVRTCNCGGTSANTSTVTYAMQMIQESCGLGSEASGFDAEYGFTRSQELSVPDGWYWAVSPNFTCMMFDQYESVEFMSTLRFCNTEDDNSCVEDNCKFKNDRRRREAQLPANSTHTHEQTARVVIHVSVNSAPREQRKLCLFGPLVSMTSLTTFVVLYHGFIHLLD